MQLQQQQQQQHQQHLLLARPAGIASHNYGCSGQNSNLWSSRFLLYSPRPCLWCVCVCNERCLLFSTSDRHSAYFYANAQCQWPASSPPRIPVLFSNSSLAHLPSVVCGQLRSIVQMGFLRVPHARALMCILCRCWNSWTLLYSC